MATRYAI